jgi:hypothetical protein
VLESRLPPCHILGVQPDHLRDPDERVHEDEEDRPVPDAHPAQAVMAARRAWSCSSVKVETMVLGTRGIAKSAVISLGM